MKTDPIFSNPKLASIYDVFDGDRQDLDYYVALIKKFRATKIIDLGCGTGELLSILSEDKDLSLVGLDPAAASVEVARTKFKGKNVKLIVGDAKLMPKNESDVIVMTANVAQAIINRDDWIKTLEHCSDSLRRGGSLVFETRNPAAKSWLNWNKKESFQTIDVPSIGKVDGWVDITNLDLPFVSFKWTYFFHKDSQTLESDSTLIFRSLEEIKDDLNSKGFKLKEIKDAPDRKGTEFIIIAQKP